MKYTVFIIAMLCMVFSAAGVFAESQKNVPCFDSDALLGKLPLPLKEQATKPGYVLTSADASRTFDVCTNANTLREAYCKDNRLVVELFTCEDACVSAAYYTADGKSEKAQTGVGHCKKVKEANSTSTTTTVKGKKVRFELKRTAQRVEIAARDAPAGSMFVVDMVKRKGSYVSYKRLAGYGQPVTGNASSYFVLGDSQRPLSKGTTYRVRLETNTGQFIDTAETEFTATSTTSLRTTPTGQVISGGAQVGTNGRIIWTR